VSRLSPYHHYGMVSPFKVARDAVRAGSGGAKKFADEFMTWRELSYLFCYHNWTTIETLQVQPRGFATTLPCTSRGQCMHVLPPQLGQV